MGTSNSPYSVISNMNMNMSGGRWRRALLVALVPTTLLFLWFARASTGGIEREGYRSPFSKAQANATSELPIDESMKTVIKALYTPILHPVAASNFTDDDANVFRLPTSPAPSFTQPLGKRVLILDIDSRPLTGAGQLMSSDPLKWNGMRPLSAGMLSHYTYALIHGYDYKFVRAPDYDDRWGTWVKVPLMREALKTHDYVVFMDSDVIMHYPHIPVEWLMNYWGLHSNKDWSVAMAVDPDEPQNYDLKGNRYLNTGFIIAKAGKRTQEMYRDWAECPLEKKYRGCGRWKQEMFHEQAAFGNYIRYDYNRASDIKVLPCVEANGAPEAANRGGCKGLFVRHYWIDKGLVAKALGDGIMQYLLPQLHRLYRQSATENIIDAKGYRLDGSALVELTPEEAELMKGKGKNQKDEGF